MGEKKLSISDRLDERLKERKKKHKGSTGCEGGGKRKRSIGTGGLIQRRKAL